MLALVAPPIKPRYWETDIRLTVKMCLEKLFTRPHLENNQSERDWRYGSSG
jgi:hypothetical protein